MPLWFDVRPRNSSAAGKFQPHARAGTEDLHGQSYRGWTYKLVHHQQGATVGRRVFNVVIDDKHGFRAGFLKGFSTAAEATAAARDWIDDQHALSSWA